MAPGVSTRDAVEAAGAHAELREVAAAAHVDALALHAPPAAADAALEPDLDAAGRRLRRDGAGDGDVAAGAQPPLREPHAQQRQHADRDGGGGQRRARLASPRNAARSEPLWVSGTVAAQRPSGPQTASAMCGERARPAPRTGSAAARRRATSRPGSAARPTAAPAACGRGGWRRARDPGERAGVARGARPQVGQLGVERVAGAGGRVAVAVAADALERHRRAARVAVGRPAARGHHDLALGRDAVQRQLPADQARERLHAGLADTAPR